MIKIMLNAHINLIANLNAIDLLIDIPIKARKYQIKWLGDYDDDDELPDWTNLHILVHRLIYLKKYNKKEIPQKQ